MLKLHNLLSLLQNDSGLTMKTDKVRQLILFLCTLNPYQLPEKIQAEQVKLLFNQQSLAAEAMAATCLFIVLWSRVNHQLLAGWLVFVYIFVYLRRKLYLDFHSNKKNLSHESWINLYILEAFIGGGTWGFVSAFLMPHDTVVSQTFVIVLIIGVVTAAISALVPILAICTGYLLFSFVPLIVWLFLQGSLYLYLAVMGIVYVVVLLNTAYFSNTLLITSLQLGFKNLDLMLSEKKLNDQLIIASRTAGMADIATSVLHNIGNVLTSINISLGMIERKIASSKMSNLEGISQLLQEHQDDIGAFLASNPKGQRVPSYLTTLSNLWLDDKNYLLEELKSLEKNVGHIKDVINKQNSLSLALGITQETSAPELIEDALKLNQLSCEQAKIKVIREFFPIKTIYIDRVKLLQIIVNLIKNSIESLIAANIENGEIILRIQEQSDSFFTIEVADNGLGILPENCDRIFHQGFTTKKEGHGFGLHASALSAQEMHGNLSAQSEGVLKGALFTLRLPYKQDELEERDNSDGTLFTKEDSNSFADKQEVT